MCHLERFIASLSAANPNSSFARVMILIPGHTSDFKSLKCCNLDHAKARLNSLPLRSAEFMEPMECALVAKLAEGPQWTYEIKLDGYRAITVKSGNTVNLLSRQRKSFNRQFSQIVEALHNLPEDTVVDGELVALDDANRPSFNFLQHSRSQARRIRYFVFDLLVYKGRDLTKLKLSERRVRSAPLPLQF